MNLSQTNSEKSWSDTIIVIVAGESVIAASMLIGMCATVCLLFCLGCRTKTTVDSSPNNDRHGSPKIIATNYPMAFFAGKILGDFGTLELPFDPELDPTTWKPRPEQIQNLQSADLVILNGAGLETWLPMVTLRQSKLVVTTEAIKNQLVHDDSHVVHQHGPQGIRSPGPVVADAWLSPELATEQAKAILQRLTDLFPENADQFAANFALLDAELVELSQEYKRQLSVLQDNIQVFTTTPAFNYVNSDKRLAVSTISCDDQSLIASAQLDQMMAARRQGNMVLVIAIHPLGEGLETQLEQSQLKPVEFSLVRTKPASGDYLTVMKENLARLVNALKGD